MAGVIAPVARAELLAEKPELLKAEIEDIFNNTEFGFYYARMLQNMEMFGWDKFPLYALDRMLGIVLQAARHAAETLQWGEAERWLSLLYMFRHDMIGEGIYEQLKKHKAEGKRILEDAQAYEAHVYDIIEQHL